MSHAIHHTVIVAGSVQCASLALPLGDRWAYPLCMTDAQHEETSLRRRNRRVVAVLLAVGLSTAIGGLVGGLASKASADHATLVASSARTLAVHSYGAYLFPGANSMVPDYTGLWIGIIVAAVGLIVLVAGATVASIRPRAA
jgi:hypothetical protein